MLAPNWPAIFHFLYVYAKFPLFLSEAPGKLDSALLLFGLCLGGILVVRRNPNGWCECMCCIEAYLARGWILLHPFFSCYGVSSRFRSKDLGDPCVQLESCLHILTFYMVLKGPFLNGTGLPVDQQLLLGCWYAIANHLEWALAFSWGRIFCQSVILWMPLSN